jgi:hypothetical protein
MKTSPSNLIDPKLEVLDIALAKVGAILVKDLNSEDIIGDLYNLQSFLRASGECFDTKLKEEYENLDR